MRGKTTTIGGLYALAALLAAGTPARAGLDRWTAEVEEDPFSKSETVMAGYMSSLRSGVFVFCDSAGDGVRVRAVPGFAYDEALTGYVPKLELAIDGEPAGSATGRVGAVGDNVASAEAEFAGKAGRAFVRAFAKAKRQVAVKDGIADRPHLLRAAGSTKTGERLLACLRKQPGWSED